MSLRHLLAYPPPASIGAPLERVSTPALLLDLDAFESNLQKMARLAQKHKVALRPHAKAHKSVAIAQAQIAHGAIGICCQKLSEAYPFAAAGIDNIHISNQFMGADKLAMAVELARHVRLSVCVDHPVQITSLGKAAKLAGVVMTVLPEVDIGQGRCGVTNVEDLMVLVDAIAQQDSLRFGGLQAYHGGAQHLSSWCERRDSALKCAAATADFVQHLAARSIRCDVVTGGGTGSAEFDAASGVYTEIQPGSYVFLDRHYASLEWQGDVQFRKGLFIAATIMSATRPGHAVCDVGLKSVAVDSGMPEVCMPEHASPLHYIAANDEHGILGVPNDCTRDWLGERILLIPGHCDPTVNLYQQYLCVRQNRVEAIWRVDARGLSQ